MIRLLIFILPIIFCDISEGSAIMILSEHEYEYDVIHVVNNHNTCTKEEAEWWASDFASCFINKNHNRNRSPDLFKVVSSFFNHSESCIKFSAFECRPNHIGFVNIMDKIIKMLKEYSAMYVKHLMNVGVVTFEERNKIEDLNCVENILRKDTYSSCFFNVISTYEELLVETEEYDSIFQKQVEKAISCSNKANKKCSESAKADMNKIVRFILSVKQPEKHDIMNHHISTEPPNTTSSPRFPFELQTVAKENTEVISNATWLPKLIEIPNAERDEIIEGNFETLQSIEGNNSEDKFPKLLNSTGTIVSTIPTTFSGEEKIDDNPKVLTISDSIRHQNVTEILKVLKDDNITITSVFVPTEENNDDIKFRMVKNSIDIPVFNNLTIFSNLEEEGIEIETEVEFKLPEDPLFTDTTIFLKFPISTKFPHLKGSDKDPKFIEFNSTQESLTTETPEVSDFSNSTKLGVPKDSDVPENGKDLMISLSNFEEVRTPFTKMSNPSDLPQLSAFTNVPNTTDFPKFSETTKLSQTTNLPKSTGSKHFMTSIFPKFSVSTKPAKLTDLPISTAFTNLLKLTDLTKPAEIIDHPMPTVSTKRFKPTDFTKFTASSRSVKPTDISKFTESTNLFKPTDRPKTSRTTKMPKFSVLHHSDLPKFSVSTKPAKLTDLPISTAFTNLLKLTDLTQSAEIIDHPMPTVSTKLFKPSDFTRFTASLRSVKPIDISKFTKSTNSFKPTDGLKTIRTTRPTSSGLLQRSRNIYETSIYRRPPPPPRPTEPPRPWYDYITRPVANFFRTVIVEPVVSLWRGVTSWFGF